MLTPTEETVIAALVAAGYHVGDQINPLDLWPLDALPTAASHTRTALRSSAYHLADRGILGKAAHHFVVLTQAALDTLRAHRARRDAEQEQQRLAKQSRQAWDAHVRRGGD